MGHRFRLFSGMLVHVFMLYSFGVIVLEKFAIVVEFQLFCIVKGDVRPSFAFEHKNVDIS